MCPETSEPGAKAVHLIFRDSNTIGRSLESRESWKWAVGLQSWVFYTTSLCLLESSKGVLRLLSIWRRPCLSVPRPQTGEIWSGKRKEPRLSCPWGVGSWGRVLGGRCSWTSLLSHTHTAFQFLLCKRHTVYKPYIWEMCNCVPKKYSSTFHCSVNTCTVSFPVFPHTHHPAWRSSLPVSVFSLCNYPFISIFALFKRFICLGGKVIYTWCSM